MSKKKGLHIPLYGPGGQFGNILRNYGLAGADATLSTFGATNVVKDSDYRGDTAQDFAKAGNIMGGVTKTALPIVASVAGGPVGGAIARGAQGVGTQFNPQDPNTQQQPYPQQGVNPNQMMNMANTGMQIYNMGNQIGAFKYGGMQYCAEGGMINAEVEKQENTLNPDGSTNQYNGPSHNQGGIKTHLDPSTMVFSDRLKLGKKTFAELNKVNNTSKEDKILEDAKANPIQRSTAELMKNIKNKNSEKLFNEQEALKQSKLEKYAKRIGLSSEGKYPDGGMTPQQWNEMYKAKGWQVDPRINMGTDRGQYPAYYDPNTVKIVADPNNNTGYNVTGLAPDNSNYASYTKPTKTSNVVIGKDPTWIPMGQTTYQGQNAGYFRNSTDTDPNTRYVYAGGQYTKMADGGTYRDVPNPDRSMYLTDRSSLGNMGDDRMNSISNTQGIDNGFSNGPNWGNIAKQVGLGIAQNAGNIYDLKRASKVDNTQFQRANTSLLDPTAALNYNAMQARATNESLREASGGNASTYIQNRKDAAIDHMRSNAQIRQSYANQNAGIQNNMSMFNTNIANQETIANEQNQAQARNLKSNAYANMGQNIMGQYGDTKRSNIDTQKINMLGQYYNDPNYLKILEAYQKSGRI